MAVHRGFAATGGSLAGHTPDISGREATGPDGSPARLGPWRFETSRPHVPLEKGTDQVVTLGTALAFISIVLAISTARGIAALLAGGWAWFGAAFGASLAFALIESLEFMLAEWVQERRGEPHDES